MRTLTCIALLVLASACVYAEHAGPRAPLPPLTLRWGLGAGFQNVDFPLSDVEVGAGRILVAPNTPVYVGVAGAWQGLGASLKLTLPGSIDAIDSRGVSEFTNLQVQLYQPRYAVDLAFQQHQGLFVDNADEFSDPPLGLRLPAMSIQTVGATFLYATDEHANLRAAYNFDQLPRQSFFSLVWMAAASRIRIDAPSGPGATIAALDGTIWSDSMEIESYSALGGIGVSAMVAFRSLFFAPTASMALGLQRTESQSRDAPAVEVRLVPQITIRASAGYNSRTWFLALLLSADSRNVQTQFLEATQGSIKLDLVFGRRYSLRRLRGTRGIDYR